MWVHWSAFTDRAEKRSLGKVHCLKTCPIKVWYGTVPARATVLNPVWFLKEIFMYHVQKCNENSLLFFSLTLNNRNRWDCLGMLEFVCCLPKLGMILCYFSSLCLNKLALLWKTKCNRLPSPPSKKKNPPMYLYLSCFKLPIRNPHLKVPTCILLEQIQVVRDWMQGWTQNMLEMLAPWVLESSGHSNKEPLSWAVVFFRSEKRDAILLRCMFWIWYAQVYSVQCCENWLYWVERKKKSRTWLLYFVIKKCNNYSIKTYRWKENTLCFVLFCCV